MSPRRVPARLRFDATGYWLLDDPVSITEILEDGSPEEVRRQLDTMASLMLGGASLSVPETRWLAHALFKIAGGGDANEALRVKGRKGAMGVFQRRRLEFWMSDLMRQGASKTLAIQLIASFRLSEGRPYPPTASEVNAEVERLKKVFVRLGKRAGKTGG